MSLSKYLAKFHGERIDALRAVREAINKMKTGEIPIMEGSTLKTALLDNKAVKFAHTNLRDRPQIYKEMKRRGFLDSILHSEDLAPKTHLIETKNRKYMVQPKADMTLHEAHADPKRNAIDEFYESFDTGDNLSATDTKTDKRNFISDYIINSADEIGVTGGDIGFSRNIGFFDGTPKVIDSGYERLNRAMTPAERKSALEKFISYGRRRR